MFSVSSIEDSYLYDEYKNICSIISNDKEVNDLLNEIKKLQNKSVFLEYNNDLEFLEVEKEIVRKVDELNNNTNYKKYLEEMKRYNESLLTK